MIHDKTCAPIAVVTDLNKLIRKQMKAISAIIELHTPQNKHEVEFGLAKCNGCYLSYPCDTIQAIEKELA